MRLMYLQVVVAVDLKGMGTVGGQRPTRVFTVSIERHERLVESAIRVGTVAARATVADIRGGQTAVVAPKAAIGIGERPEEVVGHSLGQAEFKAVVVADGLDIGRATVAIGRCGIDTKPGVDNVVDL